MLEPKYVDSAALLLAASTMEEPYLAVLRRIVLQAPAADVVPREKYEALYKEFQTARDDARFWHEAYIGKVD